MNMRFPLLAATLVLVLAGCASIVRFDVSGEYQVSGTITDSTSGDWSPGDPISDTFIVTESGGNVTLSVTFGDFAATRNGNTLTVSNTTADFEVNLTLTWTSDTTFEGTGRTDDLTAGTYWEYDLSGMATTTVTSTADGSSF